MKGINTVQNTSGIGSSIGDISSSIKIADAIQKSYQEGFSHRIDWEAIQDTVLNFPGQFFGKKVELLTTDEMMFDWEPDKVDVSDNAAQVEVLKHHYSNEFGPDGSVDELVKDYADDSVIYEVIDDKPKSYHGRSGARKAVEDMRSMLPSGTTKEHNDEDKSKFDLQHIKVNHNHAQVIWKAETPKHTTIFGTDSFTFDEDNHIRSQTIVALSQESSSSNEEK